MRATAVTAALVAAMALPDGVSAQQTQRPADVRLPAAVATATGTTATSSTSTVERIISEVTERREDVTRPEEEVQREEILALLGDRQVEELRPWNAIAYALQRALFAGLPANTVILILLLPFLATFFVFVRHVIGLPSLDMLVSITLSVTLLATGLTPGIILLVVLFAAAFLARLTLKRVRIMQLPKMALSLFIVAVAVLGVLILGVTNGATMLKDLSIFPILILIILSDRIASLLLTRTYNQVAIISVTTVMIGILGYLLLSWEALRAAIILYPELVLLVVPLNIAVGRYFGLRLTEYVRFSELAER